MLWSELNKYLTLHWNYKRQVNKLQLWILKWKGYSVIWFVGILILLQTPDWCVMFKLYPHQASVACIVTPRNGGDDWFPNVKMYANTSRALPLGVGGPLEVIIFPDIYWPCRRCPVYWRGWGVRRRRWSSPRSPSRAAPRYSRGHRPSPSTIHACKNLQMNNFGQESKSQHESLNLLSDDGTFSIVKPCLHVTFFLKEARYCLAF